MTRDALGLLVAVLVGVVAAAACGSECVDEDGDGFGKRCETGPDCDDGDRTRALDCTSPPPDCEATPYAKGCPCLTGSHHECYRGDPDTIGVGMCVAGEQRCPTGTWGACDGEVAPRFELCNAEDDDCDGLADEGALSPCGGCNDECTGGVWGSAVDPFEAHGDLAVTAAGELTLAFTPHEAETVWVPNTGAGTVSKIDAIEAREVARYRTGGAPERVAVDHEGNAWVLATSYAALSTLSKVVGDRGDCIDRGAAGIQTSGAPDDLLPLDEDDCVTLHVPVGDAGEVARALAIDGRRAPDGILGGNVWVGMQRGERVLELDGVTGEVRSEVPVPGIAPHAAVFDPWGVLWLLDRDGRLARVDPGVDPPAVDVIEAPLECYTLEAIASDPRGVLTLSGFSCENVILYDPVRDRWQEAKTEGVLTPRGVVALDTESWVAHTSGALSRVSRDPFEIVETFELADDTITPIESTAVGADSLGRLWVVSARGGPDGNGVVTRFDPVAGMVDAQVPVGRLPRGQGDLTGYQRLGEFAPEASATHIFNGCGPLSRTPDTESSGQASEWLRVHVAWTSGTDSHVAVEARRAPDRDGLEAEAFELLGELPDDEPPFDLEFESGGVVEVRLTLRVGGRIGAPRIARVGLEWRCPGPI